MLPAGVREYNFQRSRLHRRSNMFCGCHRRAPFVSLGSGLEEIHSSKAYQMIWICQVFPFSYFVSTFNYSRKTEQDSQGTLDSLFILLDTLRKRSLSSNESSGARLSLAESSNRSRLSLSAWNPWKKVRMSQELPTAQLKLPESSKRPNQTFVRQLNEMVYLVPTSGSEKPQLELVFFHGLDLKFSGEPHVKTWMSRDGSQFWPQTWLAESFPDARILTTFYQSSGPLDMNCTAENLLYSLTTDEARVGSAGCPVVFVGHCLGGLILKQICLYMWEKRNPRLEHFDCLLSNLRGMFFYGTPQIGSVLGDMLHGLFKGEGAPFNELETLKTSNARRNQDFQELKVNQKWVTSGLGELRKTFVEKLGKYVHVSPEASTRPYMDIGRYYSMDADHYDICRPKDKMDGIFSFLADFLREMLEEVEGKREKGNNQAITTMVHDNDKKYVAIERTQAAVIKAIEDSAGPLMILLHGGPGKGKTTLARYVCRLYGEKNIFDHVILVTGIVSSDHVSFDLAIKQYAILDRYSPGSLPEEVKSKSEIEEKIGLKERIAGAFRKFFKSKKILMILDDVADDRFLHGMWSAARGGNDNKILITSQLGNLCHNFKEESVLIEMGVSDQEEARKMFASLLGLKDKQIPRDLLVIADKIIKRVEGNPLALACLASRFSYSQTKAIRKKDLQQIDLSEELDKIHRCIVLGGDEYPDEHKSLFGSFKVCIDSLETKESKNTLYLMYACKGDSIPEEVIHILGATVEMSNSTDRNAIDELCMRELLKPTPGALSSRSRHDIQNNQDLEESRSWSLHSLMKLYLGRHGVDKQRIISLIGELLSNNNVSAESGTKCSQTHGKEIMEIDKMKVTAALCALYFDHHHTDPAVLSVVSKACDISNLHGSDDGIRDLRRIAVEPLIWLLDKPKDVDEQWTELTKSYVRKVFLSYISEHKLDTENLANILQLSACPSAQIAILMAITRISYIEEFPLLDENTISFLPAVFHLLNMKKGVKRSVQEEASNAITAFCGNARKDKSASFIIRTPLVLDTLADMLHNVEPMLLAECAAVALARLIRITEKEKGIHRFIGQQVTIINTLLMCLAKDEHPKLQIGAAGALTNGAGSFNQSVKSQIAEVGALPGLLSCFSKYDHPELQTVAAGALANLAGSTNEWVKLQIAEQVGALAGLVNCLSKDNHPQLQTQAARALATLICSTNETLKLQIADQRGALAGLVNCLSKDDHPELQTRAALANGAGSINQSSKSQIAEVGALPGLVSCFPNDYHPDLRTETAWALANLAGSTNLWVKSRIAEQEGALAALVSCLSKDNHRQVRTLAAQALGNLADTTNLLVKSQVAEQPRALAGLVSCLSKDEYPELQREAALALANLASSTDESVMSQIAEQVGALAGLVICLLKDDHPEVKTPAAGALANLAASTNESVKSRIAGQVGALAGLVNCLSKDDHPELQTPAAMTLANLAASTNESVKSQIAGQVGALAGLVNCLSNDEHPELQKLAALGLAILAASTNESVKSQIAGQVGAVAGLVICLLKDDHPEVKTPAAGALSNLAASTNESVKSQIAGQVGALAGLVNCLSNDDHPELQTVAARALANLAGPTSQSMTLQIKMCFSREDQQNSHETAPVEELARDESVKGILKEGEGIVQGLLNLVGGDRPLGVRCSAGRALLRIDINRAEEVRLLSTGAMGSIEQVGDPVAQRHVGSFLSCRLFEKAKLGDLQGALDDANEAIAMEESDTLFFLQERGVLKQMTGDLEGALADFNEGLKEDQNDYETLKHRGYTKFLLNDMEGASADAKRAQTVEHLRASEGGCLGATPVEYLGYKL